MKKTGQKTMAVPSSHMSLKRRILRNWELYLFLLPTIVLLLLFNYLPMFGIQIAFRNYKPYKGFIGSDWVGLKHFYTFLKMPKFLTLVKNTVSLSLYGLVAGFPLPIILAMALNLVPFKRFKRIVQTVSYAPHFISLVVIIGMLNLFFAPSTGIIHNLLAKWGILEGNLEVLMSAEAFPHLYVWSGIWVSVGWNSIIYLGALSNVDPSLHEAAIMDGATKVQRAWHIDLPSIMPTVTLLLIMNAGNVLSVGFEKVYLMQNAFNTSTSEVINTYVYKIGMLEGQYSLSTAIGLFNSVIEFILLVIVNHIAKKVGETSLW